MFVKTEHFGLASLGDLPDIEGLEDAGLLSRERSITAAADNHTPNGLVQGRQYANE
ncbi:hypothetical protein [Mesorhizobium sp.]|uniref:hypothetical protein n=1 Tax=Mesorhizobium sp. TaxID=1871066 RepID=UPI0025DB916D|nr:hypothetical protein [Mesorhizobium sp.]